MVTGGLPVGVATAAAAAVEMRFSFVLLSPYITGNLSADDRQVDSLCQ